VYLKPLNTVALPSGAKPEYLKDLNLALKDAIAPQKIISMDVLDISTVTSSDSPFQGGGLLNIPCLEKNAKATEFTATFWIETVQQPDGTTFLQLQYTQRVILNFLNINWPHISVATLVKQ
jgi:hypothetical protein